MQAGFPSATASFPSHLVSLRKHLLFEILQERMALVFHYCNVPGLLLASVPLLEEVKTHFSSKVESLEEC